jgi:hypothetical protein
VRYLPLMLLIFSAVANAADCPVRVLKSSPKEWYHKDCTLCKTTNTRDMAIQYENSGDKEITAVEFKVLFIDAVGDKHDPMKPFLIERTLAPGKKSTARWENLLFADAKKMEVTVIKVAFKDGTIWKADSQTE